MSSAPGRPGRRFAVPGLAVVALLLLLGALASPGEAAQGEHGGHAGGEREVTVRIGHGITLAATAFLAGLGPFAVLVWSPAIRETGSPRAALRGFTVLAWLLFYVLVVAGAGELAAYAARASGEPLSAGLLREALLETRVGAVWIARLGFAALTAAAITLSVRAGRPALWWAASACGGLLLLTLTQLSHAAAEGRFPPFLADWVHVVAAAVWMGGLLGFATVLSSASFGALDPGRRASLRERAARRFSKVALTAVVVLAATGLYAALLHLPDPGALVATPYGRALLVKLGLLVCILALGAANLALGGRGPFGRLVVLELLLALGLFVATGFLTSIPPPAPT